ncbi:DNA recombination protein RmuC [Acholeplasma equifetale]|jgi:DNA recombination protein RmuC|uniref:DNA recombination protein RmuC n=1 Tax=Acholeplasma equifetale TaxID=264634 RepID=UPI00068A8A36|nr:DNA recombination protein RmuC [Acholeplasma equifetale]
MLEGLLIALIILVGLLLVGFVVYIILNMKNKPKELQPNKEFYELMNKVENLKEDLNNRLEKFSLENKNEFQKELHHFRENLSTKVSEDMSKINEKVEIRLKEGFKTSNELFTEITKKLAVIDNTQKNIENLSTNVDELSRLLSDKKLRGIYGEGQLYQILDNVFGENNSKLFEKQYKLSNGTMVDAIIFAHDGIGKIPVDSKFPLENYLVINNPDSSKDEVEQATKDFKTNIKKHIDDISSKYIIKQETSDQAIMFVPSEAVFAEIHAKYPELIEYAQRKHVWLTSPTTLVYMLTMLMVMSANIEREKNADRMLKELQGLFDDFSRLFTRWDKMKTTIDNLVKTKESLDISVDKLNKKVYQIEQSDFDLLENDKNID